MKLKILILKIKDQSLSLLNKMIKSFFFISLLFLINCDFKSSAGGIENQINVVVSFEDLPKIKSLIDSIFSKGVLTPELEPYFNINYISATDFNKVKYLHHILIVSILEIPDTTADKLVKNFLPNKNNQLNTTNNLFSKRDFFAKEQVFSVAFANNINDFKNSIKLNGEWLFNKHLSFYIEQKEKHLFNKREQFDLSRQLLKKYNWNIRIQHDYTVIKEDSLNNFIWLGRAFPFRWLSVSWIDYDSASIFENLDIDQQLHDYSKYYNNEIIFLSKYRHSSIDKIVNFDALKVQGLWEHNKDVKGGPFISYFFYDKFLKKLFHFNLLVHNPGRKKLPSLLQLEIMVKTFSSKIL